MAKNHEIDDSFTLSMVLGHQIHSSSDQNFIDFSCFFKTAPGDRFWEGQGANLSQKHVFGQICDFPGVPKIDPWSDLVARWLGKMKKNPFKSLQENLFTRFGAEKAPRRHFHRRWCRLLDNCEVIWDAIFQTFHIFHQSSNSMSSKFFPFFSKNRKPRNP
jgi:hypothetical protein